MSRSSTTSSSGSGVLSWISPRTATLTIAVLGILLHLNVYSWLGAINSTLPDVPNRDLAPAPPASAAFVPSPDRFVHSAAKADQLIDFAAPSTEAEGAENKNVILPEWVAEAKAYLKAQGLSYIPTPGDTPTPSNNNAAAENGKPADVITYGRYADASDTLHTGYQNLDDGAEDVERMQWDALRLVIGTMRWYILLSVICCCAGIIGVVRSQLMLSRLFLIHSFLDFLLSTLSLLAVAIVCTYASVRAHICDEFGSGELQAWLSSQTSTIPALGPGNSAHSGPHIAPAAGSAISGTASDVTVAASGWETLLDDVFASENCEESFRTTLVPLLMVFGLFFTAIRLQCFFLVQRFYTSLLRSKVLHYGYDTSSSVESGASTPLMSQHPWDVSRRRKESKLLE
ncbi:hypothetical protein EX895_000840 [Sporisorium graminicola]|uniref:Uncharacterized protein n=1 Tax=Sporisorium graminicola TaxID=280036 RepID=A0A4U7L5P8_9BASI|nr:hypothetical protein EX895_000840 [Sporisorium graminicola]TKY90842.1 hypothetical protein EX895_000840 [Sporisorium graminicola]